jgi:hypothetical protein
VYWDLTAAFASGDRIYTRVIVTRAGPGTRNAVALGHWIDPSGAQTPFQNGRGEGEFEWSSSERRLRIGSTRFELGDAAHRFEVDNDKRGVKLALEIDRDDGSADLRGRSRGRCAHARPPRRAGLAQRNGSRARCGHATLVRTRHRA